MQVTLADKKTLVAGDWILLKLLNPNPDLRNYDLGSYSVDAKWTDLLSGVEVQVIHQIQSIQDNVLALKSPLTYPIDPQYTWTVSKFANRTEVGVEDIAFVGNFKKSFVHHGSALDDSGYSLVKFSKLTNSWMRNCRFTDVSVGFAIKQGANISVVNCNLTGNLGHEAIYNQAGTNVFFGKITDESGMWHSVGVNALAMNTVIWRSTYPASTCFESHSSQPRNTLLDFVEGGLNNGRAGGSVGNMPNHLANLIFWNYKQTNTAQKPFDFWPTNSTYWKIPYPIIVGYRGSQTTFKDIQLKYAESLGSTVNPESLYQEQITFRLGYQPGWIDELYNSTVLNDVLVYDQTGYNGKVVSMSIGSYSQSDLTGLGISDNTIGSLKIPKGFYVEAFSNGDFTGNMGTFVGNTNNPNLGGILLGQVSSIKIYAGAAGFDLTNATGSMVKYFKPGNYLAADLAGFTNTFSSFTVPSNYKLTVYSNGDLTGDFQEILGNDTYTNLNSTLNNLGNSLKFESQNLPISLLFFRGSAERNGNVLRWKTASEIDNSHFDILKSSDGKDFKFLVSLKGNGTTNEIKDYSFIDNSEISSTNYYKLKQVDFSGKSTEYDPVSIQNSLYNHNPQISVYANSQKTNLSIQSSEKGLVKISIFDLNGKKITELNSFIKDYLTDLSLAAMPVSGIYVIQISSEFLNIKKKFVAF